MIQLDYFKSDRIGPLISNPVRSFNLNTTRYPIRLNSDSKIRPNFQLYSPTWETTKNIQKRVGLRMWPFPSAGQQWPKEGRVRRLDLLRPPLSCVVTDVYQKRWDLDKRHKRGQKRDEEWVLMGSGQERERRWRGGPQRRGEVCGEGRKSDSKELEHEGLIKKQNSPES